MPIELIVQIEEYLIKEERERQRGAWAEDFKCWEERCQPADQLSDYEAAYTYHKIQFVYGRPDSPDLGAGSQSSEYGEGDPQTNGQ